MLCYDLNEHGRVLVDTDNITLYEKDILAAQKLCASITDKDKRNRAVANVIGARLGALYFDQGVYSVDTESGLHNVAPVIENYEISDIYVNNAYVDVRVYFSEEEICVPKVHFDTGILPVAYMFIKLSQDLRSATVQGFIHPESIDKTKVSDDVYYLSVNDLETFYDIESRLQNQLDMATIEDTTLLKLLDGELSGAAVISLLGELVKSKSARLKLIQYVKAQSIFNFVSVSPEKAAQQADVTAEVVTPAAEPEVQPEEESDEDITDADLDSFFDSEPGEDAGNEQEFATAVTPSGAEVIEMLDAQAADNNSEQIESLFTGEQQGVPVGKPKKRSGGFLVFLILILLGAGGAYMYNTFMNPKISDNNVSEQPLDMSEPTDMQQPEDGMGQQEEAMPVETVENKTTQSSEESASTSIPAIERSLDASVLVSNLKIDWEVPEGYASNTSAQRYLLKLGKVIHLNLKTELLLLQKPPLSNKITVELKYNPATGKFETAGIKDSSGEKTVDDLILNTVNTVLQTSSVSSNMESVSKLQGTPVLIIHL